MVLISCKNENHLPPTIHRILKTVLLSTGNTHVWPKIRTKYAYQMNGVDNDIAISNTQLLDTINRITLAAWIKPISFAGIGDNAIVEKPYYSYTNPYYQYK
jgi:hypothetical protein